MAQAQMTLQVEIPTWADLSVPVKSLINFFMQSSSLFFTKEEDSNAYTGNIMAYKRLWSCKVYEYVYGIIQLCIPYAPSSPDPFTNIEMLNDIPNIASQGLTKCTSSLRVIYNAYRNYNGDSVSVANVLPISGIPVEITPLINNAENTDTSYKPVMEVVGQDDGGYDIYLASVRLNLPQGAQIDYQMRTSSFRIQDSNSSDVHYDVFYKIGLCPIERMWDADLSNSSSNSLNTVSLLKDYLMGNGDRYMVICWEEVYEPSGYNYTIGIQEDREQLLDGSNSFAQEASLYSNHFNYPITNAIIPLYKKINYYDKLVGFAYIKLFNQDGTPFTDTLPSSFDFEIKSDPLDNWDNPAWGDWPVGPMGLKLIDTNMDGGFVGTDQVDFDEHWD